MTPTDFCALFRRITYKENVSFEAFNMEFGVHLVFHLRVTDANNPESKDNPLKFSSMVPAEVLGYFNEARALNWFRERVHEWERHEADEWLRLDGVKIFNPHGDEKTTFREQRSEM